MKARKIRLAQEQLEELENMAAAGYSIAKCAMKLDVPANELQQEYDFPDSLVRYHYQCGLLETDMNIAGELVKKAENGNLTAIQQLDKIRRNQFVQNEKQRILYGEDIPGL